MILRLYCVHDCKIEAYAAPFTLKTKLEAIRGFTEVVNDPSTQFNKYPEDFTLFELGLYDDSNAMITVHPTPMPVGKAIEFIKQSQTVNPRG